MSTEPSCWAWPIFRERVSGLVPRYEASSARLERQMDPGGPLLTAQVGEIGPDPVLHPGEGQIMDLSLQAVVPVQGESEQLIGKL